MKSNYLDRAMKFLKQFYPYIEHCSGVEGYEEMTDLFNQEYKNRKVICCHGISRIAFITSDYVIKFDYDREACDFYGGCEDEVEFYEFACQEGFEYMFAAITHVSYGGRDFYIMPRVKNVGKCPMCWANEFFTGEESDFIEAYLCDLHDENYGWHNRRPVIFDYAFNQYAVERH